MTMTATPPATPAPVSPGNPQSELNAFEADRGAMAILLDKGHPQYAETVAKRAALFTAAYPEPAAEGGEAPAAEAPAGVPVDHAGLLAKFEGGPPLDGQTPEEAMAGGEHNRTVIAGALGELGATAEETQRLVREVGGMLSRKIELTTDQAATHMQSLWRDDYAANLGIAQRALASLKNPALIEWLEETQIGNAPAVLLALCDMGKRKGL